MIRALIFAAIAVAPAWAQPTPPAAVVFFPDWSGALDEAALGVIAQAAQTAKSTGDRLTVTGYADNTGSEQANLYLTQLRAQRVLDQLVADGVAADHVAMVAKGAQQNQGVAARRAEITFSAQ